MRFRRHVQAQLDKYVAAEWRRYPGSNVNFGFKFGAQLVEWGEERVCFRCDCTTGAGAYHGDWWFCSACWSDCRSEGRVAPDPAPANVAPPLPDARRLSEEKLLEYQRQ